MNMSLPKSPSLPLDKDFSNPQLSLFQEFLCNNDHERQQLSNTIELWDSIPRYSMSRQAMRAMRDNRGHLDLLKLDFMYRKTRFNILIQPALIEEIGKDGVIKTTAYYPSSNEDLVEEVLRKLAVDQAHGFFVKEKSISGVVFTLHQLRKELARIGHARSYQQIKLSLDILSRSFIQIEGDMPNSKNVKRSTYLSELVTVSRREKDADPDAKWMARFHPLVSQSIECLSYRQFNYAKLMQHKRQLTRWMHKLLIIKYTQASRLSPFETRYSTIRRDSAMLNNYSRESDAMDVCELSIRELKENRVLESFESRVERGAKKKIQDVVFKLTPTSNFVTEVKASGKRHTTYQDLYTASRSGSYRS